MPKYRNIMVNEEVYLKLRELKGGKSFSEFLSENFTPKQPPLTRKDVMDVVREQMRMFSSGRGY